MSRKCLDSSVLQLSCSLNHFLRDGYNGNDLQGVIQLGIEAAAFLEYVGYSLEISNVSIRVQASIFRYVLLGRFVG